MPALNPQFNRSCFFFQSKQRLMWNNYYFQPVATKNTGVYDKSSPTFELPCKDTCWYARWPQGKTVIPPALVPGCGQGEHCQHTGLCATLWSDFSHPHCINQCCCPPLASLQWIAVSFRLFAFSVNFVSRIFCALCKSPCAVLFRSLFGYPAYRMAYSENTALWHLTSLETQVFSTEFHL